MASFEKPKARRDKDDKAQGEAMQHLINQLEGNIADSDKKKKPAAKKQARKRPSQKQPRKTTEGDLYSDPVRYATADDIGVPRKMEERDVVSNEPREMVQGDIYPEEESGGEHPHAQRIRDLEVARRALIEATGGNRTDEEKRVHREMIAAIEAQIIALGDTTEGEPQEGQKRHTAAGTMAAAGEISDQEADDVAREAAAAAETYVQPQEDAGPRKMVAGDLYPEAEKGPRAMVEGDIFPEKIAADIDARARDEAEKAGTKEETEKARGAWGRLKDKMQDLILAPMVAIDNERYRRWPHFLRGAIVGGAIVGVISALLCGKDGGWLQEWWNANIGGGAASPEGSSPEAAEPVPHGSIEGPLHIHEVTSGDTIWDIIENDARVQSILEGLGEEQRAYVIDALKDRLADMSPEELRALGIESGDVHQIFEGNQIDLNELLNDSELLDQIRKKAENLSEADIANIRRVIDQNEYQAGLNG